MQVLKKAEFFKFKVDGQNFVFNRDSLAIFSVPPQIDYQSEKNLTRLVKDETEKARLVDRLTLRTIALNLTNTCNFNCRYCFANHGQYDQPGLEMTEKIAQKAVTLLFKNVTLNHQKRVAIAFFGGEPLLKWDLIQKIVNFAEKSKPLRVKLRFLLTTNASLLDKEKAKYLKKHQFSVMVSLDGPRESHDCNRKLATGKGTYNLILPKILEANKLIPLTFRATITNNNLDLVKIVRHFKKLGAKMITFGLDNDHLKNENYAEIERFYRQLAKMYYQDIRQGKYYEITNFTEIILQLVFRERKVSHCNAGLSYLGVAADGSLYKCPRFTGKADHKFGEVDDAKKMISRQRIFRADLGNNAGTRNTYCFSCPFVFLCGGLCHYDLSQKGKDDTEIIFEQCQLRKAIYIEVMKIYVKLPLETRKRFLAILSSSLKGGEEIKE